MGFLSKAFNTVKSSPLAAATTIGGLYTGGELGGALAMGGLGMFGASSQNRANQAMAQQQMGFQERLSSTAHQRQVADMRRAGLNPILSAGSGASSPAGASAQMQDVLGAGISSAMQARALKKDLDIATANENLLKQQMVTSQNTAAKTAKETKILDREEQAMKEEASFRKEKAKVDEKYYEAEKITRLVGAGLSNIAGGVAGGLIGGSVKGIKRGLKPKSNWQKATDSAARKRKEFKRGVKPKY